MPATVEVPESDQFLLNQVQGEMLERLTEANFDLGVARPYKWKGHNWVTRCVGVDDNGDPVHKPFITNAPATLTRDQWEMVDEALIPIPRQRLQFVADLEAAGMVRNIPNGMAIPILKYQMVSDSGSAQLNMDPIAEVEGDRPLVDEVGLPMPISQGGFNFNFRELVVSRRAGPAGSFPLDLTQGQNTARKIGEMTERIFLGNWDHTFGYQGSTVYGLLTFPYRTTVTLTPPTAPGWTPAVTVAEIIGMISVANANGFYGPWRLYHGANWMIPFESDYSTAKGSDTLIDRITRIKSISGIRQLDYLSAGGRTNYDLILVQMSSDVIQVVNGMPFTPLQWDSHGGMKKHYKMMQIKVPQFYRNMNGTSGIIHGASA